VAESPDARSAAVGRDPVLPHAIGEDRVDDARSLARPFVEIALGAFLDQRSILPVVAGMAERRDQIAVSRKGLRQLAVPELAAADAMTEQDQRLDLVDRLGADGDVERKRSHRDDARRAHRRVVQGNCRRRRIRCRTRYGGLHPARLVSVRVQGDEQGGQ